MYGLSSWWVMSGTFWTVVSDQGGLGFHWSMKSVGSAAVMVAEGGPLRSWRLLRVCSEVDSVMVWTEPPEMGWMGMPLWAPTPPSGCSGWLTDACPGGCNSVIELSGESCPFSGMYSGSRRFIARFFTGGVPFRSGCTLWLLPVLSHRICPL